MPGPDDAMLVALTTRALASDHTPLSSREVWDLTGAIPLTDLPTLDAEGLASRTGRSRAEADRVCRLCGRAGQAAALLEGWEHDGIWVVTAASADYPERLRRTLGAAAPVVLHGAGDRTLLDHDAVGVVGSRSLTDAGTLTAQAAGAVAAEAGLTLVSGGARGADAQAMHAAVSSGGTSLGVLADSLRRALRDIDTRREVRDGTVCLVTPYHPGAPFSAGAAMGRNKIVYGLARTVLVVATDKGKGGTWSGALEALKGRWGDVAVWLGDGAGPGNADLVARGARGIEDLEEFLRAPAPAPDPSPVGDVQLSLDLLGPQPGSTDGQPR